METHEVTELIDTRRVNPDDNMTLGRRHQVVFGSEMENGTRRFGDLVIEYKPRQFRITEDGFEDLVDAGFFERPVEAEQIVSEMYHALVELLYPRSSYVERPWDELPLIVELADEEVDDHSDFYASLGSLR